MQEKRRKKVGGKMFGHFHTLLDGKVFINFFLVHLHFLKKKRREKKIYIYRFGDFSHTFEGASHITCHMSPTKPVPIVSQQRSPFGHVTWEGQGEAEGERHAMDNAI